VALEGHSSGEYVEDFEASRTIATSSGVIHNDVYLSFVRYDGVDDHFDGGVVDDVEREKLNL
jgi:hypothetical protein